MIKLTEHQRAALRDMAARPTARGCTTYWAGGMRLSVGAAYRVLRQLERKGLVRRHGWAFSPLWSIEPEVGEAVLS